MSLRRCATVLASLVRLSFASVLAAVHVALQLGQVVMLHERKPDMSVQSSDHYKVANARLAHVRRVCLCVSGVLYPRQTTSTRIVSFNAFVVETEHVDNSFCSHAQSPADDNICNLHSPKSRSHGHEANTA